MHGPNFWLVDPYLSQEGSTFGSKYVPGVHILLVSGMVQNFQGGVPNLAVKYVPEVIKRLVPWRNQFWGVHFYHTGMHILYIHSSATTIATEQDRW